MLVAAKSMALTTIDPFTDATHIEPARAEFDKRRGPNFKWTTRLADRKPAFDYRKQVRERRP
jgi:aminobenzoyl-glutamate utilization protein B